MNRAQKRADAKEKPLPMTANGRSAPMPDVGKARRQLEQPEQAGSISVAEAAEIRERKRLRDKYEADLKVRQDEIQDIAKTVTILRIENEAFLQRLLRDRGLNLDDDYNVQSETGLIWRTAEAVVPESVTVTDNERVPALATVPESKGNPEGE